MRIKIFCAVLSAAACAQASITFSGDANQVSGIARVGNTGVGSLDIDGGSGLFSMSGAFVGVTSTGEGTVFLSGQNTFWTNSDATIGALGTGALEVHYKATMNSIGNCVVGESAGSIGSVTIDASGANTDWRVGQNLIIGNSGEGHAKLIGYPRFDVGGDLILGKNTGSTGDLDLTDLNINESLTVTGDVYVGQAGSGSLFGLGEFYCHSLYVGGPGGNGHASNFIYADDKIVVGYGGSGVFDAGLVAHGMELATTADSHAVVNLNSTTDNLNPGYFNLLGGAVDFGPGQAEFNFVDGYMLNVSRFGSSLHQQGGRLIIGTEDDPGTMTIEGDYVMDDGVLHMTIFQLGTGPLDMDRLIVERDVSLAGTIRISFNDTELHAGQSIDVLDFESFTDNGYTFDFTSGQLSPGLFWDTSDFETQGVLKVGTVPEPSSLVALVCATTFIMRRIRR